MARKNNKLLKTFSDSVLHLFNLTKRNKITSGADDLSRLNFIEFQQLLGQHYRQLGYQVNEKHSQPTDSGVDIELTKFAQVSLVQCKYWKCRKVGVKAIRETHNVLLSSNADRIIIVTTGEFTLEAYRFARGKNLKLINGIQLNPMLALAQQQPEKDLVASENSDPSPTLTCPQCESALVLKTAQKEVYKDMQFYGCSEFPRCKYTRSM